jgi:hypothetical protein
VTYFLVSQQINTRFYFYLGRYFKKVIYTTNYRRPEKDLLTKENVRQTLRLVLADAFTQTEADLNLTRMIKELYASCGLLFSSLLPPSEQMSVEASVVPEDINEEDDEWALQDHKHVHPMATGRIRAKYCRDTRLADSFVEHVGRVCQSA